MTNTKLTKLANLLAKHKGVTHWTISVQLVGKGDFFHKLMAGGDCRTKTYNKVMTAFSQNWPDDLAWPEDIPRPVKDQESGASVIQEQERV